ncbi:type IV secretory system conjugative DNA transfer family protein [Tautonia sociabilis]|uniref:Type IV secretion system coupling protein TraD DNA-binding domain-containing protein n=1 Tax=Tautonia sociabilis TaxID=2080755 RepID=A0A432ML48_9BACT|nr:type IV secretion system DNA-binding domain-containing protein [Tautonia sociabilis]RUL88000.1 hypothetical protein TsocGM_09775 [Tautonia sociabilis]
MWTGPPIPLVEGTLLGGLPPKVQALVLASPLILGALYVLYRRRLAGAPIVRGREVIGFAAARRRAAALAPQREHEDVFAFGGLYLPLRFATSHVLCVGTTGSGKTVQLRLLMQSVLPAIRPGSGRRAVVYDAKGELVPLLAGMGIADPILMNPLDRRSHAWDLARDIRTRAAARQLAETFIPAQLDDRNAYFSLAAQDLLANVVIALMRRLPGDWTLRDVLLVATHPGRARRLLESDPTTRDVVAKHFGVESTLQNVLSTAAAHLAKFEPIAALWERKPRGRRLSLKAFVEGGGVLVLGNDEENRAALDAVNRVLFRRLGEHLLAGPEARDPHTFVILDEVRELGRLEGLRSLANKGRSKGVALAIGFQDIDGLRDPKLYGEKEANEIVGQCSLKAILRLESPATAKWASEMFGEVERLETRESVNRGRGGGTRGESTEVVKRDAVLPSQFLQIHRATPAAGLPGYFIVPGVGAYHANQRDCFARLAPPAAAPSFDPADAKDQDLAPWTAGDEQRLGLVRLRECEREREPEPDLANERLPRADAGGTPPRPRRRVRIVRTSPDAGT